MIPKNTTTALHTSEAKEQYDLENSLTHLLRRAHFFAEGMFAENLGRYGITSRQMALMVTAQQNPDSNQRALADLIALDVNTMSELLKRMEQKGLIERRASQTDSRALLIRLTQTGAAMLETIATENPFYQDILGQNLTHKEAAQLKSLLRKVLNT
jgi:MarR family transcriptional regulator, lower aerobic nicotinate degradation pathway regulator